MVVMGIVEPLAILPSVSKLYFTHSQHASGQSLTTWSIFGLASLLWLIYGLLNRKPAIWVGNLIALVMNLLMVNGIMMHAGWTYWNVCRTALIAPRMKRLALPSHYIAYTCSQTHPRGCLDEQKCSCSPTAFERQSWPAYRSQDACRRKEFESYRQGAWGVTDGRREGDSVCGAGGVQVRRWRGSAKDRTCLL